MLSGADLLMRGKKRLFAIDWVRLFTVLNDRNAGLCLMVHFVMFLALPFTLMVYVSDKMLGGTSEPLMQAGQVVVKMPKEVWSGFFWMANFYGALCGCVIVIYLLYTLWDKAFKTDPFLRSAVKAAIAVVVASGAPLKFVVNELMIMPASDRTAVDVLGVVDLAQIGFSPYISLSGPWFMAKFVFTAPLFFGLLAAVRWFYISSGRINPTQQSM